MPEEVFELWGDLGEMKEGVVFANTALQKQREQTVHYAVKGMREAMNEIYQIYNGKKKPKAKDFVRVLDKYNKKREDDITDYLDKIENEEDLFKIVKRKSSKGKITIELEKISNKDRIKLIKSITEKLIKRMKPEHIHAMIEEGIKKNNDIDTLKRIDKKLDSKKDM